VTEGSDARTVRDLEPVRDEISEEHVQNVLWRHSSGVRALLAPPNGNERVGAERYRRVVDACRAVSDVVVVHLPRSFDPVVTGAVEVADRVILVVSLDVLAFRDAKRAVEVLDSKRWDVVVNRATRGLVAPEDVERVFGRAPLAVLPHDRRVPAAQDRGELVPARSRVGRAVERLASAVLEGVS
jgi:pilus assembly protein CpaE